jgi:hypothetical protein
MDGYVDEWFLQFDPLNEDGTLRLKWHDVVPAAYPYFDTRFLYHGIRTTQINNRIMAMTWIDSSKSWRYRVLNDERFARYSEVPEIYIIVSNDDGANWTEPLVLNTIRNPELGTIPTYVWPADKIYLLSTHWYVVRFYFMYTNDLSFGSYAHGHGEDLGSEIRYAAANLEPWSIPSTDDQEVPRPVAVLNQNFPNPFNPSTVISFIKPRAGKVSLNIYNVRGQLVKTLIDEGKELSAGEHRVVWHGVDNNGRGVASGVYFYRLETGGESVVRRMVLMK